MRAFKVFHNGKLLCLAGVGEKDVLSAIVDYVGRDRRRLQLTVSSLNVTEQAFVKWVDKALGIGDEIRVRIVESDKSDAPRSRMIIDPKDDIRMQKRYVRSLARKFGWKIKPVPRRKSKNR